jgi:hypothetical protein
MSWLTARYTLAVVRAAVTAVPEPVTLAAAPAGELQAVVSKAAQASIVPAAARQFNVFIWSQPFTLLLSGSV